jgi:hypothetical protein
LEDVAEEHQRGLRRPVDVVEDEEDRRLEGGVGQPGGYGVEQAVALGNRVGVTVGGLLSGHRGGEGVDGGDEGGQDAVPGVLDLLPAGGGHRLPHPGEVLPPEPVEGDVAEAGHELGRTHEIGEQHRGRPAGAVPPHGGSVQAALRDIPPGSAARRRRIRPIPGEEAGPLQKGIAPERRISPVSLLNY